MKNAIILHGTNGSSQENWFPWLKKELEALEYQVWVPDLPGANEPNIQRYNEFLMKNKPFELAEETILVGHSSGAVAILGLLEALPENSKIHGAFLVGAFKDNLARPDLTPLFKKPLDFEAIKSRSGVFVFVHSDDDPYCPLDHAKFLSEKVGGRLVIIPGQKHFSISTSGQEYNQFPKLLELIKQNK